MVDALALLGVVTAEINQFRWEQMRDWLPGKMQALTKSIPPESKWLFGNDLTKRINQLNSTNSILIKTSISPYNSQSEKNNRYPFKQSKPSTSATNNQKNLQSSQIGSVQGKRWTRQQSNGFTRN